MTIGKIIALSRWTFVGKVMSLLFNMLSSLVVTFLPRSKCLLISWLQSPSAVIFEAQENKVCHCFHCFPSLFAMKWWDWITWPDARIFFFKCWVLSQVFHSPLSLSSKDSLVLLLFHKGGVIYISDFSPGNLDSSCASSSLAFHMMYFAYKLNKRGSNIQPWHTLFPIWNQSMFGSNCCFLTCIQISQEAGRVVWYSHLLKNFPQFVVIHTVKGFSIINEVEDVFFWNSLAFSVIQWMLEI